MFYVIPGVKNESIKAPIHIVSLFTIDLSLTPYFQNIINKILLSCNSVIEKKTK